MPGLDESPAIDTWPPRVQQGRSNQTGRRECVSSNATCPTSCRQVARLSNLTAVSSFDRFGFCRCTRPARDGSTDRELSAGAQGHVGEPDGDYEGRVGDCEARAERLAELTRDLSPDSLTFVVPIRRLERDVSGRQRAAGTADRRSRYSRAPRIFALGILSTSRVRNFSAPFQSAATAGFGGKPRNIFRRPEHFYLEG